MLPNLGQTPAERTIQSTHEHIHWTLDREIHLIPGKFYVTWGARCPVWHRDRSVWEASLPAMTANSGTCRMLCDRPPQKRVHAAEVFAGSMGGWTHAIRHVKDWSVQWALDSDGTAASNYCLNHGAKLIKYPERLTESTCHGHLIVMHDVRDLRWLSITLFKEADVWCVSWPCQPWSSMGYGAGTASSDGQVLLSFIQCARLAQPLAILLENVAGFRRHHEHDSFLETMKMCGFVKYSAAIHNLSSVSYMNRRRWLAVYLNTLRIQEWKSLNYFMAAVVQENSVFDPQLHCHINLTPQELAMLKVTKEEFDILDDPTLLPTWLQDDPAASRAAASLRVYKAGSVLPVVQASYRRAGTFDREYLRKKGYMAWLVRDQGGLVRWFSKFEAALALGFPGDTILPAAEDYAFTAVGNSIAPMQAALAICSCCKAFTTHHGRLNSANFVEILDSIRHARADLSTAITVPHGDYHVRLHVDRMTTSQPITCPHCHAVTLRPLVIACHTCHMVACENCASDECLPSHTTMEPSSEDDEHPPVPSGGCVYFALPEPLNKVACRVQGRMDIVDFRVSLNLPLHMRFFQESRQLAESHEPREGDEILGLYYTKGDASCPQCERPNMDQHLRICSHCGVMGCLFCVAQVCYLCYRDKVVCDTCHQLKSQQLRNTAWEENDEDGRHLQYAEAAGFSWIVECTLLSKHTNVLVLFYPNHQFLIPRAAFNDVWRIKTIGKCKGLQCPADPVFLWGKSFTPDYAQAIKSGIMVVPSASLNDYMIPARLCDAEGDMVLLLPTRISREQLDLLILREPEVNAGITVSFEGEQLSPNQVVSVLPGSVIKRGSTSLKRCWSPTCSTETSEPQREIPFRPVPVTQPTTSSSSTTPLGLRGGARFQSPVCVGINGRLVDLPKPLPGMTWPQWVGETLRPPLRDTWATLDGNFLDKASPLPQGAFVLRLRYKLRGGTKPSHATADVNKLKQHLTSKGVPEDRLEDRVHSILQVVTPDQLSSVYSSLEPWALLKQIVGTKVRLVELRELKAKTKPKATDIMNNDATEEDPWKQSDPWSEAAAKLDNKKEDPVSISLVSNFFEMEDGTSPDILPELVNGCRGVSLMTPTKVETLSITGSFLSSHECAAITASPIEPKVAPFKAEHITFLAEHSDAGKMLLRGYLVNFGEKRIKTRTPANTIHIAEQNAMVVTIEVVRQHVTDWQQVTENPLKFAWRSIEGLQRRLLTTWSRKYFYHKKPATAHMATTWHAFGKILASEADDLLRNSGVNGVFLSPKSTDGGPASNYKVVWTEVDCLQKALTIARTQSMIYGIVRGKSNFGYRVKALEYTQARQTLEPTWEKDNIHYDILIKERYVMTPLPLDVDKAMLQTILDRMQWKAMPLKQLGPSTWMVGAETPPTSDTASFRQELVLITKEMPKQSSKQPDTAVVAAPQAIRKTLDRQLKHAQPRWDAQSSCSTTPSSVPQPAPHVVTKQELDTKMKELTGQVDTALKKMEERVTKNSENTAKEHNASIQQITSAIKDNDERQGRLERQVQDLTDSICTKSDMATMLSDALARQSADFQRIMLAKRPQEASPANDPNKLSKQS